MYQNCQKPFLADIIDFQRDIEPYNLILIHAGVGAGKNTWTKQLAEQGYRVLVITSRAITANVQAQKLGADRRIDLNNLYNLNNCHSQKNSTCGRIVCTNADIEHYVKEKFDPNDIKTHIWNSFDFIILDEAHSLVTDASFADSPFHVHTFLDHAHKCNPSCHIVLMTGTPTPIESLIHTWGNIHILDFFDKCNHIEPETVTLIPSHFAINRIINSLRNGERLIYFANSIGQIARCVKELQKHNIPEADIGITFNESCKDEKFSKSLIEKRTRIQTALEETELIPDDVKILFSTIKNKEGININNKDIKTMYAESHQAAALTQMAGRIRNGLSDLYIIFNAADHPILSNCYQEELELKCVNAANETLVHYSCLPTEFVETPNKANVINTAEKIFYFVRFNYLTDKFEYYPGRQLCVQQQQADAAELDDIVNYWEDCYFEDGLLCGSEEFRGWFPYSKLWCYIHCDASSIIEKISGFLITEGYVGSILNKDDRDILIRRLNLRLSLFEKSFLPCTYPIKQLGKALPHFGYQVIPRGKSGTKWEITEMPKDD